MTDERPVPERIFTEDMLKAGLHAYADGMLDDDPALRAAVEARLASDPAARQEVEDWQAINAAIRASLPPMHTLPPRLANAFGPGRGRKPRYRVMAAASAMAAMLALGFFTGQHAGDVRGSGPEMAAGLPADVVAAMSEERGLTARPVADAAMAGMDAARAERIGLPRLEMLRAAPDLSGAGFGLKHFSRMAAGDGQPMLRATYVNADGEEVELLVMAMPSREVAPAGDGGRVFWSDGHLAYGLTAAHGAPDLDILAKLAAEPHNWDIALETREAANGPILSSPAASSPGIQPITTPGPPS
ncbi:putative transmembrane anti-sigma factor [Parvibaculum lavamentivorans DS-1]|uniref:Putative transmembrane anti-sigma factor n=1 Tax=Parvibaculum lavamentivorans (strain DS-1 / DSM 13023 / NCIMB 13966) TaxID=402881 RepID=A7HXY5_PARL1|nr:putative transmembrane anti-sigma factor [Parvibaculum lavamentivorans]ABS64768.1 putative transmembrane anti-sigma factor [Parvibaculum lavamentivorans DS-1]